MFDWIASSFEGTPAQREFLHVLRAAVAGHAPDDPPADWASVLTLASAHQVAFYLYPLVRTWEPSFHPAAPLEARWRVSFLSAAAQYMRVAVQVRELLTALHTANIRVIPLKGIWLAERVYDDGACRPMNDIDLLVPDSELARAREVVERLGYTSTDLYMIEACNKHVHYQKAGLPLTLELHWRLWCPNTDSVMGSDLVQMWAGLHEEHLQGVPVWVFSPERQLIYLSHHILRHTLTVPMKAYLDLVLFCRHYASHLDLSQLENEACAWRGGFGTRFVLRLAHDLCATQPPAVLRPFLALDDDLCKEACSAAVYAALQLTPASNRITPELARFCHASGLRRLQIGVARILWSPSQIRQQYPQVVNRFGLAGGYIWRCVDLFRRHGRVVQRTSGGGVAPADLANFETRQALTEWVHIHDAREDKGPRVESLIRKGPVSNAATQSER